jgi:hypothetical protein
MAGRHRAFRRVHVVGFRVEQRVARIISAAGHFHQIVIIKVCIEFVEVAAVLRPIVSPRCRTALLIATWAAITVATPRRAPFATFLLGRTTLTVALRRGKTFAARVATVRSAATTTTPAAGTARPRFVAFRSACRDFAFGAFHRQIVRWFVRRVALLVAFHGRTFDAVAMSAARI